MLADTPLSRIRKLVVGTSIFLGRFSLEPQSAFLVLHSTKKYKGWKMSIYEHIRIRILATKENGERGRAVAASII